MGSQSSSIFTSPFKPPAVRKKTGAARLPLGATRATDSQSDRKPKSPMGGNGDRPSRSSSVAEWLVTRLIFSHQPLLPHEEGQSSGRRKASEPPSASSTEPQKKRASGP